MPNVWFVANQVTLGYHFISPRIYGDISWPDWTAKVGDMLWLGPKIWRTWGVLSWTITGVRRQRWLLWWRHIWRLQRKFKLVEASKTLQKYVISDKAFRFVKLEPFFKSSIINSFLLQSKRAEKKWTRSYYNRYQCRNIGNFQ